MSLSPRIDTIDKNYIINGGFRYWQRDGISAAVNTTTSYIYQAADRWLHCHTGTFTGTPNVQRNTSSPNDLSEFSLIHRFQRNAGVAQLYHQQRIESILARQIVEAQRCSLSFYVNPTLNTGTIRVRLAYATVADNHTSQVEFYNSGVIAITSAATWTEVKLEDIAVPALALNGIALFIEYDLPSGTDGSVQSIRIAQVMLNKNRTASKFTPAGSDVISELELCQRYYEKSYNIETAPGTITSVDCIRRRALVSGGVIEHHNLLVAKRSVCTITYFNPFTGASNTWRNVSTSTNVTVTTTFSGTSRYSYAIASGLVNGEVLEGHFTADAEIN